jgi:hypothetical protein
MTLLKAITHATLLLGLGLALSFTVWGQDAQTSPAAAAPRAIDNGPPSPTLVSPDMLQFVQVFGFGAMIFLIWWGDYRKIGEFRRLTENYETLAKNHEALVNKCHDTMLLTMDVNAKLTAKLEFLLARDGRGDA